MGSACGCWLVLIVLLSLSLCPFFCALWKKIFSSGRKIFSSSEKKNAISWGQNMGISGSFYPLKIVSKVSIFRSKPSKIGFQLARINSQLKNREGPRKGLREGSKSPLPHYEPSIYGSSSPIEGEGEVKIESQRILEFRYTDSQSKSENERVKNNDLTFARFWKKIRFFLECGIKFVILRSVAGDTLQRRCWHDFIEDSSVSYYSRCSKTCR